MSAVARRPEVLFLMPGEDLDEAKQQRYGDDIPDDFEALIVTFGSAQDDWLFLWGSYSGYLIV